MQDFECPYCLDRLKDPVILKCAHNMCRGCVVKAIGFATVVKPVVSNDGGKNAKPAPAVAVEEKDGSVRFSCARCTKVTILENGVQSLLANKELADALKQLRTGSCERCDEPPKPAVTECLQCQCALCEQCQKQVHVGKFKTHQFVAVGALEKQRKANLRPMCRDHRGQELVLFCNKDMMLACLLCHTVGAHKGHECLSIDDAAESLKLTLQESLATAEKSLARLEVLSKKCVEGHKAAAEDTRAAADSIEAGFLQLRMQVEQQHNASSKELEARGKEIESSLLLNTSGISTLTDTCKSLIQSCKDEIKQPKLTPLQRLQLCHDLTFHQKDLERTRITLPTRFTPQQQGDWLAPVKVPAQDKAVVLAIDDTLMMDHWEQMHTFVGRRYDYTLLYRGSRDGFDAATFHRLCDNQAPTLTVIMSDHYHVFGGFTQMPWTSVGSYYADGAAFLFGLAGPADGAKKFASTSRHTIFGHPGHGPTFGNGHEIYISNACNTQNSCRSNPNGNFQPIPSNTYFAGTPDFHVLEIEVFVGKL